MAALFANSLNNSSGEPLWHMPILNFLNLPAKLHVNFLFSTLPQDSVLSIKQMWLRIKFYMPIPDRLFSFFFSYNYF